LSKLVYDDTASGTNANLVTYRITRLGLFLRVFSLDELPKLFNVVRGSMSLVGPRPRLMSESAPEATEKVSVKPGLTGLWQVSGYSDEDANRLDREYAKRWSLWLDIKIMAKTLIEMLRSRTPPPPPKTE
jgi:lipopolysaccharide/colanic/teichoic acid biosynthesis glycosyltransferase